MERYNVSAMAARVFLLAFATCLSFGVQASAQTSEQGEFFEKRIRPVLASRCYTCHTGLKSGGLRLDSRENILKGGNDGAVIVPGHPEQSLLIKAISHTHERLKMPLNGPKLDDETIDDFKQWIRDGAVSPETPEEFFNAHIRPVVSRYCLPCHNANPQGGLRLDSREAMLKGGQSGPALVPGDAEKSLLVQVTLHKGERFQMPPGKMLADEELGDLVAWVRAGAVWAGSALTSADADYQITADQRGFWSFQPVKKPAVPRVKNPAWVKSPVDRFILAELEKKKLKSAPIASRRVVIRRATYDLTGLPPTPKEVRAFLADRSPKAFAKVVDRLLASPYYGERWGRHWLDVVRYADSAGDSADYPVPQAYLYRNYVIDSFNRDKPYNEFIREQVAGDLIPAHGDAERWDHVVATGYLAISKRFSVRPENYKYLTIDDTIDNLGKTFLGMTIACARCHDHKYDPISSKDYYALYGIFDGTRYPFAGSENYHGQKDFVYRLPQAQVDSILKPYNDRLKPLDDRLGALEEEKKAVEKAGAGAATDRDKTATPVVAHRTVKEINKEIAEVTKQRAAIRMEMPELDTAYAVAEGNPHNARVMLRGDPKQLGDEVQRHFLQILGGQELPAGCTSSGRLQLADWVADPKNPLTPRVMANRIWQYHFGKGLVSTPSDFGKRGKPPTYPGLLDYLAARFVESGWSMKALHRLIMLSRTYQLASDGPAANSKIDPANDLRWKFDRQRLDAESIRDAMLDVTGDLDPGEGGAHPFPHAATWNWTQHRPFSAVYETNKRSVYLMVQRSVRHPYLSTFDGADPNVSTGQRTGSTTPLQALYLMNSEFIHERSKHFAARLIATAPTNTQRLNRAFEATYGRLPTPAETRRALDYFRLSQQKLRAAGVKEEQLAEESWASLLRAMFASNEFVYID